MPVIAQFYGIVIQMFWDDHNPPHFHARYGNAKALFRIADGSALAESCRLPLRFSDGTEAEADLRPLVESGGQMVEPLRDQAYFSRAFVELGAPTWPNGFDLDPINLYVKLRDAGLLKQDAA